MTATGQKNRLLSMNSTDNLSPTHLSPVSAEIGGSALEKTPALAGRGASRISAGKRDAEGLVWPELTDRALFLVAGEWLSVAGEASVE